MAHVDEPFEPPCAKDLRERGREWVEDAPPRTRAELAYMVSLCRECPLIEACHDQALDGLRDIEGKRVGGVTGVYGGLFWRNGKPMNPLSLADGDRQSVYARTHFDVTRGMWRAQVQVNGRKEHVKYSNDEDTAGVAAAEWIKKNQPERGIADDRNRKRRPVGTDPDALPEAA